MIIQFRKIGMFSNVLKSYVLRLVLTGILLFFSSSVCAEFYEYLNEDGVKCYTDDISKIPLKKNEELVIHKEKVDGMDAAQRQMYIEKENQKVEDQKRKTQTTLEELQKKEQQRQALEAERERLENLYTRVTIDHNRILVPVTFGHNGSEITANMILDTGASMTALHRSVAQQIQMPQGQKSLARVAGGGFLSTRSVTIDYIRVGSKKWDFPTIMVIPEAGPRQYYDGLLGQDFLRRFSYTIDYDKSSIRWTR